MLINDWLIIVFKTLWFCVKLTYNFLFRFQGDQQTLHNTDALATFSYFLEEVLNDIMTISVGENGKFHLCRTDMFELIVAMDLFFGNFWHH